MQKTIIGLITVMSFQQTGSSKHRNAKTTTLITPVSDVATEYYCYTEDRAISAAVGTVAVGYTVFIIAPELTTLLPLDLALLLIEE